jgi:ADP-ribose pyrophosphatase YjhB (NUDIX family)
MTESPHSQLSRKRVGAGALITDTAGRVLMVEPTYKDTWEVPGGVVEAGESAVAACQRECVEERLARRIRFALQARDEGRTIELVDGRPTVG